VFHCCVVFEFKTARTEEGVLVTVYYTGESIVVDGFGVEHELGGVVDVGVGVCSLGDCERAAEVVILAGYGGGGV